MSNSKNLLLIGPPNSGKTTLFNWMTGYKRKTVNFPGSTVEMALAPIKNPGSEFKPASPDQKKKVFTNDISSYQVMDTPGIYSFFSASEERECILNLLKDSVGKKALRRGDTCFGCYPVKTPASLIFSDTGFEYTCRFSSHHVRYSKKTGWGKCWRIIQTLKGSRLSHRGFTGGRSKGVIKRGSKWF